MGFFSWNCPGCGMSIRSGYTNVGHRGWMKTAVAVFENGTMMRGEYDGYGRINDWDLSGNMKFALWHEACWDQSGRPKFAKQSTSASDQGYFCDELFTIFPPGHDPQEIERTHLLEADRVINQLDAALLPLLGNKGRMTFEKVKKNINERAAALRKKIMDELDNPKPQQRQQ